MLWASIPLTVLMAVLSAPAAKAVFHRRQFTAADAAMLGTCLAVYSVSLIGSALQRSFLAPFFARLDTRVPLLNTVYGVVANLALLPLCILPWGFSNSKAIFGVALAYSLAQYVNVGHAWYRMRRDLQLQVRGIAEMLLRLGCAGLVMGGVLAAGRVWFLRGAMHAWVLLARTCLVGALGLAAFVGVAAVLGFADVEKFVLRRRADTGSG
jgi:putative peptidoglycan lipid II flippase